MAVKRSKYGSLVVANDRKMKETTFAETDGISEPRIVAPIGGKSKVNPDLPQTILQADANAASRARRDEQVSCFQMMVAFLVLALSVGVSEVR